MGSRPPRRRKGRRAQCSRVLGKQRDHCDRAVRVLAAEQNAVRAHERLAIGTRDLLLYAALEVREGRTLVDKRSEGTGDRLIRCGVPISTRPDIGQAETISRNLPAVGWNMPLASGVILRGVESLSKNSLHPDTGLSLPMPVPSIDPKKPKVRTAVRN